MQTERNLELVRAVYRALADGGSTEGLIAADAEYVNPPYAVEPGVRPWSVALERLLEIYPTFALEPSEFVPVADDLLVVMAQARATGASGVSTTQSLVHVWTIRDGLGVRFHWFNDRDEAFAAVEAGL